MSSAVAVSLPGPSDTWRADLVAGLTTGVMLVPQAMAYATLAGLEPIVGLYASTLPLLIYAALGSSRVLAVGPVAMDSLMVGVALLPLAASGTADIVVAAAMLAVMVGAVQLVFAALGAGRLLRLLSPSVVLGFTAAAALIIGASQLKAALGVALPRSQQLWVVLSSLWAHLGEVHAVTLAIAAGGVLTLSLLKKHAPAVPRSLVVVVVSTLAVWTLGLHRHGVAVVGDVPAGLPSLVLPRLSVGTMGSLIPDAIAIGIVAVLEAFSVAKRYDGDAVRPRKELVGLGLSNVGAGLVGGYPVTGGFSRTAVNADAGAQTRMAGVVTAGVVALTLVALTPLFTYLPRAALASIILAAVAGLIDVAALGRLASHDRPELLVALVTGLGTLTVGIPLGLASGVLFSLALGLSRKRGWVAPSQLPDPCEA